MNGQGYERARHNDENDDRDDLDEENVGLLQARSGGLEPSNSFELDGSAQGHPTRNCPEDRAGWISKIFYFYVNGLMEAGAKKHLEHDDLWDLSMRDQAAPVFKAFAAKLKSTVDPIKAPQGTVWRAIWRTHGKLFVWAGVLKLVHDLIMFLPSYILERLLHHMGMGGSRVISLALALAILGSALMENITINIYFHILYRMSLHLKTAMIQMIYAKSLRITSGVKSRMGVGSIVNLQSNDASKIWNMPLYLHIVWNGPFQIFVVMALLVRIMHFLPAMAGLVVTVIMIPLSTFIGKALGKARREMLKQTDARVKLASEIITGIKAIKLYAWEEAYMERVKELRETELRHIRHTQLLSMFNIALFTAGPILVSLAAFSVYTFLGYPLTASVAFPALALFNLLRFPILMFPSQVMNMINARVGLQRIQKFMEADEMVANEPNNAPPAAAAAAAATHSHDPSKPSPKQAGPTDDSTDAIAIPVEDEPLLDGTRSSSAAPLSSQKGTASAPSLPVSTPAAVAVDSVHASANGLPSAGVTMNGGVEPGEAGAVVVVRHGSFAWDGDKEAILHDIDLCVQKGQLIMVVGQVGSGKSSLLAAILGEMYRQQGVVKVSGSAAYTSQDPWIQNSTVRSNLLMGRRYDEEEYITVLAACALAHDLELLSAGDSTEIGEKGVNLSGGQKHRVALARAAYAAADLYLLDDPLSAVDAHVGRHLFDECICGLLGNRTRILVTHQLQYLPSADKVVVMADGQITEVGTYDELTARGVDFGQLVSSQEDGEGAPEQGQPQLPSNELAPLKAAATPRSGSGGMANGGDAHSDKQSAQQELMSAHSGASFHLGLTPQNSGVTPRTGLTPMPSSALQQISLTPMQSGASPHTGLSPMPSVGEGHTGLSPTPSFGGFQQAPRTASKSVPGGWADVGSPGSQKLVDIDLSPAHSMNGHRRSSGTYQQQGGGSPNGAHPQLLSVNGLADGDDEVEDEEAASPLHRKHPAVQGNGYLNHHGGAAPPSDALVVQRVGQGGNLGYGAHGQLNAQSDALKAAGGMAAWGNGASAGAQKQQALRREASKQDLAQAREQLRRLLFQKERDGRITKVEERAVGQVDRAIYKTYLSAWSPAFMVLPIFVVVLALSERGMQVGQNVILSAWSNAVAKAQELGDSVSPTRYLLMYFGLGMSSILLSMMRSGATIKGSITASRKLHYQLLNKLVRLPMAFYDSQPTGRLLNRMTKDTESIDLQVGGSVSSALTCMVNAVLSMVVVCVVSPVAMLALGPLLLFYWRVQAVYIASSRELKRLDSLAFSPIFQHYSESLHGLITIRAFRKQPMFLQKNRANLDHSNRAYWPIQVVNRWLSVRLEMMGAVIVFVTTLCVAVLLPANPGISGLAITSALNLTGIMNWMVRQMTELEVNMNSVERMVEYNRYEEEAPALLPESGLPSNWPTEGVIEARALTVKYRPELPAVLKGLSFSVRGQEKVGVCGRTGCGKSTLMITLYRLVEPTSGFIFVDGIDITTLGLADLRSRLSLVPQDPVIFSGTIRSNLDPFATAGSDVHIWEALARAGMDSFVAGLDGGLNAPIQEGGANLSTGQRQLLCMARALLRASRILVLDEATSNVDNTTDALIQRTIRSAFSQCTVLTIAHRLHTIIDSDRVLLLESGMLKEFDTPHALMGTPGSAFRALVEETTGAGGPGAQGVADSLHKAASSNSLKQQA